MGGGEAGFPPWARAAAFSPYGSPAPGVSDSKDWKDHTGLPRHDVEGGLGVIGIPGALLHSPPPPPPLPLPTLGAGLAAPLDTPVDTSNLCRLAGGSLSWVSPPPVVRSITAGCCLNCGWDTGIGNLSALTSDGAEACEVSGFPEPLLTRRRG